MATASMTTTELRGVLGHFATGVAVVAAVHEGRPYGMAVNSFTSVSLQPPLVAFCASNESTTWPSLRRAGAFAISVLAEGQERLGSAFGTAGAARFTGLPWTRSPHGQPLVPGAVAWLDCAITRVLPVGDHDLVLGEVAAAGLGERGAPLVFFRGGFVRLHRADPS
jgi:3-hydroxy-9,10-secoandrosta-1,3,5(10)-triene-9,17-dione monooxygenase reductase component